MCLGVAAAQAQGVNFEWRAADLLRHQRAFSAPRTFYAESLAAYDRASQADDLPRQLPAMLDAASAVVWLGAPEGEQVLARLPKLLERADAAQPEQREVLIDLLAYQAMILTADLRLDAAQAALARADALSQRAQDPGHRAALDLAWSLVTLLGDDAPGALRRLDSAYEVAVHDLMRALIITWQASITRRASDYQYDLLRTALLKGKESDRLAPPDAYPMLGLLNISVLAQSEAVLGEQYEAVRHGRQFSALASGLADREGISYSDAGMIRILSHFRRQDIALAEQLGRRRVLLTWGLLAAALLAGSALTAIVVQARQRRSLQAASGELEQRNAQLRALHQAQTRLLAASCHDLREPAHALCLLADLAASDTGQAGAATTGTAPSHLDEHLATIRYCSMKLTDMLSELLDLTRIEGGHYVPESRTVPLDGVLEDVDLYFQEHARRQGITLEVARTDLHVRTDPYLLRRILLSLVGTAIKTTHAGLVRVSAQHNGQGQVELRVRDSSPGMAPEVLSAMLDRGSNLALEAAAAPNLDLGVSIVKRAAQLLEMPLEVTSQSGRGNMVRLTLEHALPPTTAPAVDPGGDSAAGRLCIAVLEDDGDSRQGMALLLKHWSYDVVAAATADELEAAMAESHAQRLDLLITDLHLGAHDGLQEAQTVRRWPGCKDLPVLLLTGDQDETIARAAAQARVILNYKPLLPRQLLAGIQSLTHRVVPPAALRPGAVA